MARKTRSTITHSFPSWKRRKNKYERYKGKESKIALVEFGEEVLYKPLPTTANKRNKMEPKFEDAIFLGVDRRIFEYVIGISRKETRYTSPG